MHSSCSVIGAFSTKAAATVLSRLELARSTCGHRWGKLDRIADRSQAQDSHSYCALPDACPTLFLLGALRPQKHPQACGAYATRNVSDNLPCSPSQASIPVPSLIADPSSMPAPADTGAVRRGVWRPACAGPGRRPSSGQIRAVGWPELPPRAGVQGVRGGAVQAGWSAHQLLTAVYW